MQVQEKRCPYAEKPQQRDDCYRHSSGASSVRFERQQRRQAEVLS